MNAPSDGQKRQASLSCLVDTPELLKIRILPAEFARLLGVSKQAVSRWIAAGKVSINPVDGRLDVQTAVQQVLRNTDPGRMRARVLRAAVADVQQLRRTAAEADERAAEIEARLGAELAAAREVIAAETLLADRMAITLDRLFFLLVKHESDLRATANSDEWHALVVRLDEQATAAADATDALDDP